MSLEPRKINLSILLRSKWGCKYKCRKLSPTSGTEKQLDSHHRYCRSDERNHSLKCRFCGKAVKNRSTLAKHEKDCVDNPTALASKKRKREEAEGDKDTGGEDEDD
jgi:hypothetical protein